MIENGRQFMCKPRRPQPFVDIVLRCEEHSRVLWVCSVPPKGWTCRVSFRGGS